MIWLPRLGRCRENSRPRIRACRPAAL